MRLVVTFNVKEFNTAVMRELDLLVSEFALLTRGTIKIIGRSSLEVTTETLRHDHEMEFCDQEHRFEHAAQIQRSMDPKKYNFFMRYSA